MLTVLLWTVDGRAAVTSVHFHAELVRLTGPTFAASRPVGTEPESGRDLGYPVSTLMDAPSSSSDRVHLRLMGQVVCSSSECSYLPLPVTCRQSTPVRKSAGT